MDMIFSMKNIELKLKEKEKEFNKKNSFARDDLDTSQVSTV